MDRQTVKRPFLSRTLRGCALRTLIQIVIAPIFLCCVIAWIVAMMWMIDSTYGTDMQLAGVLGAVLSGIGLFTLLPAGIAIVIIWRQVSRLDAAFTPLGLTGSMYALRWRQYRGLVGGRELEAKVYRGPTVNLSVKAPLGTRMGIGTRTGMGSALSGFFREHLLELDDPAFAHLAASAHDQEWARGLLTSEARPAILRLLTDVGPYEMRTLGIAPEALSLTVSGLPLKNLTAEVVQAWLDDLLAVLDAAEDLPAPTG